VIKIIKRNLTLLRSLRILEGMVELMKKVEVFPQG